MFSRKRREERRKEKFVKVVSETRRESQNMSAMIFLKVAQEELDAGNVRDEAEWRQQWMESEEAQLDSALAGYVEGLRSLVGDAQLAEVTEAIRWQREIPASIQGQPLPDLIARRTRILVEVLVERGFLERPPTPE